MSLSPFLGQGLFDDNFFLGLSKKTKCWETLSKNYSISYWSISSSSIAWGCLRAGNSFKVILNKLVVAMPFIKHCLPKETKTNPKPQSSGRVWQTGQIEVECMWVCIYIHNIIYYMYITVCTKLHPEKWNLQKWNGLTISMSNCCFTEPFFTSAFNTPHRWVEDNFWVMAGWRISKNDCNAGWKLFSIHHGRTFETLFFDKVWLSDCIQTLKCWWFYQRNPTAWQLQVTRVSKLEYSELLSIL